MNASIRARYGWFSRGVIELFEKEKPTAFADARHDHAPEIHHATDASSLTARQQIIDGELAQEEPELRVEIQLQAVWIRGEDAFLEIWGKAQA